MKIRKIKRRLDFNFKIKFNGEINLFNFVNLIIEVVAFYFLTS